MQSRWLGDVYKRQDSLGYFPIDKLKYLTGGRSFCSACFNGNYPTKIPTDTRKDRFEMRLSDVKK